MKILIIITFNTILLLLFSQANATTTVYVSPVGNNKNTGKSEIKPYKTIQYAIDQMNVGDTLLVLDGFYTGSVQLKSGITIKAKNPRKAIFSGTEPLKTSFKKHTDKIYKTKVDKKFKQLFYNNEPMVWAQWPNVKWSDNWDGDKKWAKATVGTGPGVLTSDSFSSIKNLDLAGAYCFIRYGKGNSCYSRLIESFNGKTLHWNDYNFYSKKFTGEDGTRGSAIALKTLGEDHEWHPNKSKFFLAGSLDLLDAPGEWFVKEDILYLYPTNRKNPEKAVILAQTIDYCIDEKNELSGITIEGIDFFGSSIRLENRRNKNINFKDVYFSYIGGELLYPDRIKGTELDKPISVAGSGISFEKCLFAGAQNTALKVSGLNVSVDNCVFMENNRHANFESRAFTLLPTGTYKITRNTFFNNCSDAIMIRDCPDNIIPTPEISFNNIFNAGRFNSDVSGVYMPSGSQGYSEFHHNWMHNIHGNAIRLDLGGEKLTVHHNVFWASKRGMNIEGYGKFNIYNNTSVHNQIEDAFTRNILNHSRSNSASLDSTFSPITDWNIINNISEKMIDRVGPREAILLNDLISKKSVHPERIKNKDIPVSDRGSVQGNLTGMRREIFTNADLSGLNLIPKANTVKGGISQTKELDKQGVRFLDSFRGAYDVASDYWYPGSNWMPYGLKLAKTMAEAEAFAKKLKSVSIIPAINIADLPKGRLR
jgi:hypothetical protein